MNKELQDLLKSGAESFSAKLNPNQVEKFNLYMELLKEWNAKFNLTAIEDDRDVVIKHFIDSLSILPYIGNGIRLIDVGTGAGFPGIPLKIIKENIKLTLLDSLGKRVKFLEEAAKQLELSQVYAIHGRAEDFGADTGYREQFDICTARAVANLPVLLEYCLPFVKENGIFIAMKTSNPEEVESSKKALEILGGKIEEIYEITLPQSTIKRSIIVVRKYHKTPVNYPRKAGKASKEPII